MRCGCYDRVIHDRCDQLAGRGEARLLRFLAAIVTSNLASGAEAEDGWAAAQGREGAEKVAEQAWWRL